MAARKKSSKTSKKSKASAKKSTRKKSSSAAKPAPVELSAEGPGPTAASLRGPVRIFTIVTILVFILIWYVYGPCSDFARFSQPVGEETAVPILSPEPEPESVVFSLDNLPDVQLNFTKKEVSLTDEQGAQLDQLVALLKAEPSVRLQIIGHTCNIGQHEDNELLSEKRAEAVRAYLQSRGVSGNRLQAVGRGESEPIASNSSEAGRIRNRRVEFRVLEQ